MTPRRIFQYIDQPVQYGTLSLLELVIMLVGLIVGATLGGAILGLLGLAIGYILGHLLQKTNNKGLLKKYLYFNFVTAGQPKTIKSNKRFFI